MSTQFGIQPTTNMLLSSNRLCHHTLLNWPDELINLYCFAPPILLFIRHVKTRPRP